MGGLVVAALLVQRRPDVRAAVLSAPALTPATPPSRTRLAAARLLRRVAPRLALPSGIDPQGLSRDPEVVRRYVEDPLVFRHMPPSTAVELLDTMQRTLAGAARVAVPALVLHGQDDPICAAVGSRSFHAALPARGSLLRVYPKLRHEIFNEPEQEEIFRDLLDWLHSLEPRV
jgi:alpha-beta hydrolase superfamily lysophospholipase